MSGYAVCQVSLHYMDPEEDGGQTDENNRYLNLNKIINKVICLCYLQYICLWVSHVARWPVILLIHHRQYLA